MMLCIVDGHIVDTERDTDGPEEIAPGSAVFVTCSLGGRRFGVSNASDRVISIEEMGVANRSVVLKPGNVIAFDSVATLSCNAREPRV